MTHRAVFQSLQALRNKLDSAFGNPAQKTPKGKELRLPGSLLRLFNPALALFQVYICLRCYGWQNEQSELRKTSLSLLMAA